MNNPQGTGFLIFENTGKDVERISINWELTLGLEFSNSKSWKADVWFPDYSFTPPEWISSLIFRALSDPIVKVHIQFVEATKVEGHISDILDLADCGVIELSSLDLPRSWMTINQPNKK